MSNKKSTAKPIELQKVISIKGANLHNLKNIDIDIPRNKLTVITGVSGSGKSSLAFDTIYAEGQRRFVESLSSYARQFLERMGKPEVESISGLPPAVAIQQVSPKKNNRSTVGTTTEVYEYLRLLYGRVGTTFCHKCGKVVARDTPDMIVDSLIHLEEGTKLFILFQFESTTKDCITKLEVLKDFGLYRILMVKDNSILDLTEDTIKKKIKPEEFYIILDRLALRLDEEGIKTRLTDSVESALSHGNGKITIYNQTNETFSKFSSLYECNTCEIIYQVPEPKLFSFNTPQGACPMCQGFGLTTGFDESLVVPDRTISLRRGAIMPFKGASQSYLRDLIKVAPKFNIELDIPYNKLSEESKRIVWEGTHIYEGINGFFKELEEKSYKVQNRVLLSRYKGYTLCKSCHGSRLRTSARQVFINGKNIPELLKEPLNQLLEFFKTIKLNEYQEKVAGIILNEIKWRLQLLVDIGLEYLTLERTSHTLSGGEAQRINLSTAIGSSLVGTLYVLDEPSIGLHQKDSQRLLNIIFKLRNLGNTVIVVEHDLEIMSGADYIIDMGPKAGEHGGEIIFKGTYDELLSSNTSLTSKYLNGSLKVDIKNKKTTGNGEFIKIIEPRKNNLKLDEMKMPLGCLVTITGVSGSGKSTLISDILYTNLHKNQNLFGGLSGLHEIKSSDGSFDRIEGANHIDYIELVDQTPIGRTLRSTPATFTKVFDFIRDVFAGTQAAKQFGWKSGYFSFNILGGRCEVCQGEGYETVEMQFLSDVTLLCETCKGSRYKREINNVLFNGKSIIDVLNMNVEEACVFFKDQKRISSKLEIMKEVGLGYIKLGQPSTNLSGGEAQRLKLANYLEVTSSKKGLFIFDEPTTGLHLDDIAKLLICFRRLVEKGNSVVLIEHNMHLIAASDWIIDLGPDGGNKGGEIIASSTPEKLASNKKSYTGIALKKFYKEI